MYIIGGPLYVQSGQQDGSEMQGHHGTEKKYLS